MENNNLIKNKIITKYLDNTLKSKTLSHAYLFVSNNIENLEIYTLKFIKSMFCKNNEKNIFFSCEECNICKQINSNNYLDLYIIDSDSSIKKEEIIFLKNELKINPMFSKKVYWIKNAEKLTKQAANSLLKILEEPEDNIIAILTTKNLNLMLETIISRTQVLKFEKINNKNDNNNDDIYLNIKNILDDFIVSYNSNKNLSLINLLGKVSKKEDVEIFLNVFIDKVKHTIYKEENYNVVFLYKLLLDTLNDLKMNVNPQLLLEAFVIELIKNKYDLKFLMKE